MSTAPATYDAADGYDLWLLAGASTWTYSSGTWSNITSSVGVPDGMETNTQMVYDALDGYVLLFGGATGTLHEQPLSDTWKFSRGVWVNLTAVVGTSPPPGALGVMAYDSEDREVVLYGGGEGTPPGTANQTWTYAAGHWTNVSSAGPPPLYGRYAMSPYVGFTDDPQDGYVLYYTYFGGGQPTVPQTWAFRGGIWRNLTGVVSPDPDLSYFNVFSLDTTSGVIVAQAHCTSTATYTCAHANGTFEFRNGGWADVTPSVEPSLRLGGDSWVDDPSDGGVLFVGGCCWLDVSGLSLEWQDVWIFSHGSWHEEEPWVGSVPSWVNNDGTWIGVVLLAAVAPVLLCSLRYRGTRTP